MRKKKKRVVFYLVFIAFFINGMIPSCIRAQEDKQASFDVYASVYDFGARVDKIVLELPQAVNAVDVSLDTFGIQSANESAVALDVENGERQVQSIVVSDSDKGSEQSSGKFIILTLETKLHTKYAEILQWNELDVTNVPLLVKYRVVQNKPLKTEANEQVYFAFKQRNFVQVDVDKFSEGKSIKGLNYRDFKPKNDGKKHPLIVWLHGEGEGGDNNITQINGNRGAVAFVNDEAQKEFDSPYVLAPQSPDYWMPEWRLGDTLLKGTNNTDNIVELIMEYIDENHNIDRNRIYLGGFSMGGYQAWETLFAAPELFAAIFPICASYEVPQEQLHKVKNIPAWIVHTKEDPHVPVAYSRNAYGYLKRVKADVIYTECTKIQIMSENYDAHETWIPLLNNEVKNSEGEYFFAWLASQKKSNQKVEQGFSQNLKLATLAIAGGVLGALLWKRKSK